MALSDDLQKVLNLPADHPEAQQWLSLIPAIGGAMLQARTDRWGRPTRLGAPLGAGLGVLGEFGMAKGQQAEQTQNNQRLSEALAKATTPQQAMQAAADSNSDPVEAAKAWYDINRQPAGAKPQYFAYKNKAGGRFIQPTPDLEVPPDLVPYTKPTQDKPKGLTGEEQKAAGDLGIPFDDADKITQPQWRQIAAEVNRQKLAGEKGPEGSWTALTTGPNNEITGFYNPTTGGYKPPPAVGLAKAGTEPKPPTPKVWTAKDAAELVATTTKTVMTDLTKKGFFGGDIKPGGSVVQKEVTKQLDKLGYTPEGMPKPQLNLPGAAPLLWK